MYLAVYLLDIVLANIIDQPILYAILKILNINLEVL